MGKGKLKKFAELETFRNVYQKPAPGLLAGKWASAHFQNDQPLVLELACGKGDYTLALAKRYPQKNFIGVDIKGNRIWNGARTALESSIENAAFLRIFIDHIDEHFALGEVNDIWITFPDPYLRKSKKNKRLTSPKFLDLYRKILAPNGSIHLKTDSPQLFEYTQEIIAEQGLEVLSKIDDVYKDPHDNELLTSIQTYYEKMHLEDGRTIRYIHYRP
ncbi:MAG: tRNA (guanosine(46)-N7)-methyltransferase TrmB [Saprospiraceae bacterium]|nr:tRNA (guanosine(46)-N7)-methyltransferase TrmB [Saprospiraceae bacterium]